jgi:hypothetical protein
MSAHLTSPRQASKAPRQQLPSGVNRLHLHVTRIYCRGVIGYMPKGADVRGNVRPTGASKSRLGRRPARAGRLWPTGGREDDAPMLAAATSRLGRVTTGAYSAQGCEPQIGQNVFFARPRKVPRSGRTTQARKSRLNEGPSSEAMFAPPSQTAGALRPPVRMAGSSGWQTCGSRVVPTTGPKSNLRSQLRWDFSS